MLQPDLRRVSPTHSKRAFQRYACAIQGYGADIAPSASVSDMYEAKTPWHVWATQCMCTWLPRPKIYVLWTGEENSVSCRLSLPGDPRSQTCELCSAGGYRLCVSDLADLDLFWGAAWVRERTRPPLLDEVSGNFCACGQRNGSLRPYSRFSRPNYISIRIKWPQEIQNECKTGGRYEAKCCISD
jgi:hypothetical protein